MTLDRIKMFFQPSYLFSPYPNPDMMFLIPLLTFFGGMIVLSLVSLYISRKKKKKKNPISIVFAYIYNWFFWMGILGLSLLFFRYEGINFLSMRFLLLLTLIGFFAWGLYVFVFYKKEYKKMLKNIELDKAKNKYFVKRRK